MTKTGKRLLTGFIVVTVIVVLTVVLLIGYSNRILKRELEKSLGKNFSVQRIALSWGSVDAYGLKFSKEDVVVAQVEKVNIKADFLGLLKKHYSLSRLTVEKPMLHLTINKEGKLLNPLASTQDADKKAGSSGSNIPFEIGHIAVKGGLIHIKDDRFPSPDNVVTMRDLNVQFDNFSLPFKDVSSRLDVAADVEGGIISGGVTCKGNYNLKTAGMNLRFDGKRLQVLKGNGRENVFSVENIAFNAASKTGEEKNIILSNVVMVKPFLKAEVNNKGEFVNPFQRLSGNSHEPAKQANVRVTLKNLKITGGEILYLNGKVARPPHATKLEGIELNITDLSLPFSDNFSVYNINARIPGKSGSANLKCNGKTNFKTKDTNTKIDLKNLDITDFKPYFQKKGDADVTKGSLDLDMDLSVRSRLINAPGTAAISDLEFRSGKGLGDKFIGVPRSMVLSLLKTGNDQIVLDFKLEGSLDDPKFNITEGIVKRLTVTLAKKLGLSVVDIGETVVEVGVKGVKEIEKGLKDIGDGLQKIFK